VKEMVLDKKIIIVVLIIGFVSLVILIGVIGQGSVRQVQIFYPEKIEQTVVFQDVEGKVRLVGVLGAGGKENPTLVTRTNFAYILTVINEGDKHHRLYIDGLEVQTDLLEQGRNQTLTIFPKNEGVYNYYDKREMLDKLGQLKVVTVIPADEFEGILKDLI
jgi:hypothetical protein